MITMSVNDEISLKNLVKFYSSVMDRYVTFAELKSWELKIGNLDVYVKSGLEALER